MKIEVTRQALAQINRLPTTIRLRVAGVLERLSRWPQVSGAKPLSGPLSGWYRIRTGGYRIRFTIVDDVIVVDRVAHRKDVYKE